MNPMLALLVAAALFVAAFAGCPSGYTETTVTGETTKICLQLVYSSNWKTQSEFNTLCSSGYSSGYLVVQSSTAQKTAVNSFAQSGNSFLHL